MPWQKMLNIAKTMEIQSGGGGLLDRLLFFVSAVSLPAVAEAVLALAVVAVAVLALRAAVAVLLACGVGGEEYNLEAGAAGT